MYPICAKCDRHLPEMLNLLRRIGGGTDKSFLCSKCADALERKHQIHQQSSIKLEIAVVDSIHNQLHKIEKIDIEKPTRKREPSTSSAVLYACKVCYSSFGSRKQLYNHERVHKLGAHPCNLCTKKFRYKHALRRHQQLHTDERPFPCDMCNKTFRDLTDLRRHKFKHNNAEKSFKCPNCDGSFYENNKLNQHLRTRCRNRN